MFCGTVTGSIVERELQTGLPSEPPFDPQFGALSDLVVRGKGVGTQELVQFQKDGYEYARWRVDGPGIGARL